MKFLLLPLLLLSSLALAQSPGGFAQPQKKWRAPTELDVSLKKDADYEAYQNYFIMRTDAKGYDPYLALYRPEYYMDTAKPLEKFVASYHVLKDHAIPIIRAAVRVRDEDGAIAPQGSGLLFPPENSVLYSAGMELIKLRIVSNLMAIEGVPAREANTYATRLFAYLGVEGATESNAGLVFFGQFVSAFDKGFPDQGGLLTDALKLEKKLDQLLGEQIKTEKNLYDLTLEITRDHRRAVKLLGLLMGREIQMHRYFEYMEHPPLQDQIERITRIPKLVRAYTDWLQWQTGTAVDSFSFPGRIESKSVMNHYFWTEAYLAQQLAELGIDARLITRMCHDLVLGYQDLRKDVRDAAQRMRMDTWYGVSGATLGGVVTSFIDQIFGTGNGTLTPFGMIAGGWMGKRLSRKIQSRKWNSELRFFQELDDSDLAYDGAQFGVEVNAMQACEDTWAPNRSNDKLNDLE